MYIDTKCFETVFLVEIMFVFCLYLILQEKNTLLETLQQKEEVLRKEKEQRDALAMKIKVWSFKL